MSFSCSVSHITMALSMLCNGGKLICDKNDNKFNNGKHKETLRTKNSHSFSLIRFLSLVTHVFFVNSAIVEEKKMKLDMFSSFTVKRINGIWT